MYNRNFELNNRPAVVMELTQEMVMNKLEKGFTYSASRVLAQFICDELVCCSDNKLFFFNPEDFTHYWEEYSAKELVQWYDDHIAEEYRIKDMNTASDKDIMVCADKIAEALTEATTVLYIGSAIRIDDPFIVMDTAY